jgi:hypothetical protein
MELRTFTAESPKESWNVAQVLKEVFRIWSETKPKDFVTAKNNDDVLPLNVPLCIPIPPRISSVHSISHRYQSSKLIFDIGSDGKDRRHPQIIEFNMRLNALKWIYHPFVSSDSTFEEDYPFMLPEKQHNLPNLWSSYFFNNPLPPISHRQKDLFDLLPIEISKMILDRLDWSSLVELARSNVSIAAMAVAFDLKDKFGLICVLLRWRDLSRELKAIGKAFENSDYYAKYGRYLTDDLHFAGCNKPWGTVQKEFASFLNN